MIEYKVPDLKKYMAICYDKKDTKSKDRNKVRRHYRRFLESTLEESNFIDKVIL